MKGFSIRTKSGNRLNRTAIAIAITISVVLIAAVTAVILMSRNQNGITLSGSSQDSSELMKLVSTQSMPSSPPLGDSRSKVIMVEFGDYQCTYCARFHKETKDKIISDFVNTGQVRFLFKDFPINDLADKASSMAAEASYCAADQGLYWKYHDELYNNWRGENTSWVSKASLLSFGRNIGIQNLAQFSKCLDEHKYSKVVSDNYSLAGSLGLSGTPSFILIAKGKQPLLIPGAAPYSEFKAALIKMQAS